jgi:hypothetical protein
LASPPDRSTPTTNTQQEIDMRTLETELNSETYRKLEKAAHASGYSTAEDYAAALTAEKVGRGATAKRVKVELSPTRALKIAKVAEANGQSMGEAVASLLAKSVGHAAAGTSRRTRTGRARQQGRVGRSTTPTKSRQSQGVRFSVALTEREARRVKEAARREGLLDGLTFSEIAHRLLVTFADCHLGGEA